METNANTPVFVAYNISDGKTPTERPGTVSCHIDDDVTKAENCSSAIDRIQICKTFSFDKIIGSFFSCIYQGKLRIHLVFNEESDLFNDEIIELIHRSISDSGRWKSKTAFS